jgi:hypothetical protein
MVNFVFAALTVLLLVLVSCALMFIALLLASHG